MDKPAFLFLFFFTVIMGSAFSAFPTHIKAGEITYKQIDELTFRITITGYRDIEGTEWGRGILKFGDGEQVSFEISDWNKRILPDEETQVNTLVIDHIYPFTGKFNIEYTEQNRNSGILNINNGNSINIPFHIQTSITIDPTIGNNSSPQLLNPPIDKIVVGQKFTHNPWAIDPDDDSLVFSLTTPLVEKDKSVPKYLAPNDGQFSGATEIGADPAIFKINRFTGDLIWDAPGTAGEYSIAFKITEWRKINNKWMEIGFVTRDMQILVTTSIGSRPFLFVPADTCLSTGENFIATISFEDPDGDSVSLETFSQLYELENSPAELNVSIVQTGGAGSFEFVWETNASHFRVRPYLVYLKITDHPSSHLGHPLTTYQTIKIGFDCDALIDKYDESLDEDDETVTGVLDRPKIKPLQIYPNPSNGKILIDGSKFNDKEVYIRVDNTAGVSIYKNIMFNSGKSIGVDLSELPSGIYIIRTNTNAEIYSEKIMIE